MFISVHGSPFVSYEQNWCAISETLDLFFGMSQLSPIFCRYFWEPTKFVPRSDQTNFGCLQNLLNAKVLSGLLYLSYRWICSTKLLWWFFFLLSFLMDRKGLKQYWQKQDDWLLSCRLVAVPYVVHRLSFASVCKECRLDNYDLWLHQVDQLPNTTVWFLPSTACIHNAPASGGGVVATI